MTRLDMHSKTAALSLALLGACAAPKSKDPLVVTAVSSGAPAPPVTISIIGTNDVHGQLERLPFMAGYVDNVRKAREKDGGVLLVDAGDSFQGTIESSINEGAAVVSVFARMGYASTSLGNHEFDFGPSGPASMACDPGMDPQGALKARMASAPFPFLASNLVEANGQRPPWKNLAGSTLATVQGVRIGIIGLLTAEAADVIKSPNFAGLRVTPLADAAVREARLLREQKADLVVVAAHAGGECTHFEDPTDLSSCDPNQEIFRFARALPPGTVDVIVGGHRNAAVAHVVAGIPVVHAPSHLVAFSRVDVVVDGRTHRVLEKTVFPPHPVCETSPEEACAVTGSYEGLPVVPDTGVLAITGPAMDAARALRERDLGVKVEGTFAVRKEREGPLGNLFADLMREAVPGADGAFGNAGSIRDDLPQGKLTYGQLHHVMPFDNQLAKLHVTGAQLRRIVTVNLLQKGHGPLAISGVGVIATCGANGEPEVTLTRPDGATIRDDQQLLVVTNDFIALGGDGLLASVNLPEANIEYDGTRTVLDVLIAGLEKRQLVSATDPELFDPHRPRLRIAGGFPLICGARQ